MNIVLEGAGFANKGAEAMARTTQVELARRLPDSNFFLWRPHPWECRPALNSGFHLLRLPFESQETLSPRTFHQKRSLLLWEIIELFRSGNVGHIPSLFSSRQRLIEACMCYFNREKMDFRCFIDISGFAYGDTWGLGNFKNIAPLIDYFGKRDRPIVFLPQAWGSFDKPHVRESLCKVLRQENCVFYSRDARSSRYLEQALDLPQNTIPVSPDIVFNFQGGTPEQGEHVLRSMGCTLRRPIICIAPNIRVYKRVPGQGSQNAYLKALVQLANHCLAHYDIDVVLQANEIAYPNNRQDDRYLCSLISASVRDSNRCFMTRDHLTAEATKSMIGHFHYLIASRYHSLVFGLSQGIPGMALSWSHKYKDLFSIFDMQQYVHEHQQLDPEALIATFEHGWSERKILHDHIIEKVKHLQTQVVLMFDDVARKVAGAY